MKAPSVIAILALLMSSVALGDPHKKPNILFLFADDWARYASVYQDPEKSSMSDVIYTPNVDRLAKEGALFTNAFNPVPSCTPCRGSIMTGQYFWRNGRAVNLGGGDFDPGPTLWETIPKFPRVLEYLGYKVGFSGKIGVEWWRNQSEESKFIKDHHKFQRHGNMFMNFSENVADKPDMEAAVKAIMDEVRENFRDMLKERQDDQPFFYWFGTYTAHRSWVKGSGKKIWGIDPDDLKGKLPADWPDVHAVREDIADYFGEVQAFDAMVEVLMEELERIGELDNTLIVATGDNGMPGFPRAKRNLYDKGVYAPLMVKWSGVVKPGRVISDFVNLMDLAPTFIEAGGGAPPSSMDGKSLVDVFKSSESGRVDSERDHVILGRERHTHHIPMRAIRTDQYLLIENLKPEKWKLIEEGPIEEPGNYMNLDGSPTKKFLISNANDPEYRKYFEWGFQRRPKLELYDVRVDSDQMNNLANNPKYREILGELKDRLETTLAAHQDPRFTGDWDKLDLPPFIEQERIDNGTN